MLLIIISNINCTYNLIECSSIFCFTHLESACHNKEQHQKDRRSGVKILVFGINFFLTSNSTIYSVSYWASFIICWISASSVTWKVKEINGCGMLNKWSMLVILKMVMILYILEQFTVYKGFSQRLFKLILVTQPFVAHSLFYSFIQQIFFWVSARCQALVYRSDWSVKQGKKIPCLHGICILMEDMDNNT